MIDADRIAAVLDAGDDRFTLLVWKAGLNPMRDMRGANLGPIRIRPEESIAHFDFSGAILAGADLRGVDLTRARFDDTDLTGADLRGATVPPGLEGIARCDDIKAGPWSQPDGDRRSPPPLPDEAMELQAILDACGDDDDALSARARVVWEADRYRFAEQLYAILLDRYEAKRGPEAPETLTTRHNLARSIVEQGRAAEAERAFADLLPDRERVSGTDHPYTLTTRYGLARAILDQGRAAEAERAFADLLPDRERVIGADHPYTLTTRHGLVRAILDQGRAAEAERAFADLLPDRERVSGADHPHTLTTRHGLVRAILDQGRAAEAERAFADLLRDEERVSGADHPQTLAMRRSLARSALEQGSVDRAETALAPLPPDGGDPNPLRLGQTALLRGWLADIGGDATGAEAWLDRGDGHLAHLDPAHSARRELARYRESRTPGGPGGTALPHPAVTRDGE